MLTFSKSPPRPQTQSKKPSYPRHLGLGALLLLAACGGTAIEGTSEGAGGQVAQAGSGGGEIGGAAPFPMGGSAGEAGAAGAGGQAEGGTGGYQAEGGSIGGGAPIEFEDAGPGGAAGQGNAGAAGEAQAGSGGGDPAGDIAEPYDAGSPDVQEPSPDGFAPEPYPGQGCPSP